MQKLTFHNMKRIACIAGALLLIATPYSGRAAGDGDRSEFNRHWYLQVQAGAAYTLGETSFGDLVSPAAALSAGYRFSPVWGLRFGLSGWQARGAWASPASPYDYNFLQGNVEATLDLANLFGRFNPTRTVNPYLFAGVGLNYAFNNDEAVALNDAGYTMDNIWSDSKAFAVGRMGVGVNFRVSNRVQLSLEVNANILSDKFNSKKAGNVDWHFNALAGLSIRLGKSHRKAAAPAAVPATPVKPAEPAETPQEPETQPAPEQPAPTPAVEKPQPLRENIFFRIGKTNIREEEQPKIRSLVDYLKKNTAATVRITGYADAATGSQRRNLQLSEQRARNVSDALQQAGIPADRISIDYKGDTEQPFSTAVENRVSICIAR